MYSEKRKKVPQRHRLVLSGFIAIVSLAFGVLMSMSLAVPETNIIYGEDLFYNLTPTGLAYLLYATEDIPCGTQLNPDVVIETRPEHVIYGSYYPQIPRVLDAQLETLYTRYTSRDIKRSERIGNHNLTETPSCNK